MSENIETQNQGGTGSCTAQIVFDALTKSGAKNFRGFPTSEERDQLRKEKADRDIEVAKRRAEIRDQRREEMKEAARQVIQRNRIEQV